MIKEGYKNNFETLKKAIFAGHAGIVECTDKATGKPVMAICAFGCSHGEKRGEPDMIHLAPLAKLFDGDPYEELIPPGEDGLSEEGVDG